MISQILNHFSRRKRPLNALLGSGWALIPLFWMVAGISEQRQKNQIPEAFRLAEFDPRIGVKRDIGSTGGSSADKSQTSSIESDPFCVVQPAGNDSERRVVLVGVLESKGSSSSTAPHDEQWPGGQRIR